MRPITFFQVQAFHSRPRSGSRQNSEEGRGNEVRASPELGVPISLHFSSPRRPVTEPRNSSVVNVVPRVAGGPGTALVVVGKQAGKNVWCSEAQCH